MKITLEEVRRIAQLAHLQFSDDELERLRGQLDQILGYVDQLKELDTEGIDLASSGASERVAPLREDKPQPSLPPEEALANAPESGRGHFKVPRVLA